MGHQVHFIFGLDAWVFGRWNCSSWYFRTYRQIMCMEYI